MSNQKSEDKFSNITIKSFLSSRTINTNNEYRDIFSHRHNKTS